MLARSRDALLAAGACLLALGLGWVVTFHLGLGRWLDSAALQGFTDLRRPAIDPAAQALADIGNAVPMALLGLALVAWALARGRPRVAAAVPALRAAGARWPARTGREAAVRLGQALAPTALIGLLGAGAVAALVVLRPAQAVAFAQAHTTFIAAAAGVAGLAAALVAGLA